MEFKKIHRLVKKYLKRLKKDNVVSIVQVGSTLRKKEFVGNSDLDLLVIYENSVRDRIKIEYQSETEVNLIRRGKQQYLKYLKAGNPVDLIALKFGKVLWDKGFFKKLKRSNFEPTAKTHEFWMHTASFNISDAFCNYSLPTCICCYFKSLHHAARDFSRAIILKERNKLVEGDKDVIMELKKIQPHLVNKYRIILDGRRNYDSFRDNPIKTIKIRPNQRGKFLLSCEDFAILAYKNVLNMNLPKINNLISNLQNEYKIDHFSSYFLEPETMQILITLSLKSGMLKMLKFDLAKAND